MQTPVLKSLITFLFLCCLTFSACKKHGNRVETTPAFNPKITAFTSGLISANSNIRVILASDIPEDIRTNQKLNGQLFDIDPKVKGAVVWIDDRTVSFKPENNLSPGENYKIHFKLNQLFPSEKKLDDFVFGFTTIPLDVKVNVKGFKSYSNTDLTWNAIEGEVITTDVVEVGIIESMLAATQKGELLTISWDHNTNVNKHAFVIDSVERLEENSVINISWDGKVSGLKVSGSEDYEIPALGNFILMEQEVVQYPDQYISLRFSDPIKSTQELKGLISIGNQTNLRFSVNNNEVRVYPNTRQYGSLQLTILPGIQNILGYKSKNKQILDLSFEEIKPAIRLIGEGVILPGLKGTVFPFEAVNLKAVDVKVIKIFESNVAQFLQVNNLAGNNQLKRAGRLILKKTVDLIPERPINFNQWNAFSLDLSELVETDPGAIYRIELSFRKKHSLFSCPDKEENENLSDAEDDFSKITESDLAYWDASYDYYDYNYNYSYYNWREKDDPCTDSYFNYYRRKVAKNILASNLGIIAKKGNDNSFLFAVTDLVTTEPMSNVELKIMNFQQQLLASLKTNAEGIAKINLKDQPYLLVASKDKQRGYLKLDGGSSLSLSQFDVSGTATQKGLKGFIYGERGVWRPGDDIHLCFILDDREKTLPENHPVVLGFKDPQGKTRQKLVKTKGSDGIYYFKLSTEDDDPTGNWNATITVGGVNFYKSLRIETVKPNRLKIKLKSGNDIIYSDLKDNPFKIQANWLHGAVAKNLKFAVDVNYRNINTKFDDYKDYTFNDITKNFNPSEKTISRGQLNNEGKATVYADMNLYNRSPGMVNAILTTRVFEEGGDFSISRQSIPYSPYPVYVGLKSPLGDRYGRLLTDTVQTFKVVTLKETGEPVRTRNLNVKIYKISWRWWWHAGNENLASYTGNSHHKPVFDKVISTNSNGEANFGFKLNYPDWGRFLVVVEDPSGGHSTAKTVYFDWPGYAGRASRKDPKSASILAFSSDKSKYYAGETATISIPTSNEGRIFLSIENGTKVIDHYWIEANGTETSFSFTVTEEMAPNVFVNVSLLQPHSQTANDLPIRMYGVIPLLVENKNSHLHPEISMKDELKPESETEIRVKEKNGKEMSYTLAIVDEGLLDLTNYKTPEPWYTFNAREALGVRTFDLYNLVIGAWGGRIDGVFSIGGGDETKAMEPKKRANRFPPMVKFVGPFKLKPGAENKHTIKIPNYVGSVRTMVIAASDNAWGQAEKTLAVKKPLMVLATLPRVVGPGEKVKLPVTVFCMDEKIKKVKIKLEANDLFSLSSKEKEIVFEETGDQTVDFEVQVKDRLGVGNFKISALSGNEQAHYDVEIEVRSPNPEITEFSYGMLEPGESFSKELLMPGMPGTNSGILEVSVVPPVDFGRRLKFLIRYPHGCIEQTTSAAFPQLYLADVMESNENLNKVTSDNIKAAITRISKFALPSGGFGYWPNSTLENEWGSCYAGHFLLQAREKAYSVPDRLLKNWVRYERKTARRWTGNKYSSEWHKKSLELTQAYRLYLLALAGEPEIGAMNRLKERTNLNTTTRWKLAAAYALAGQPEVAKEIIRNLSTQPGIYSGINYTYGSPVRDAAMVLETLTLLNQKEKAIPVMLMISENLSSNRWYSTQTTAYSLMAVAKYLGLNTAKEIRCEFSFDNQNMQKLAANHPVAQVNMDLKDKTSEQVEVKNTGEGTLFVRFSVSGIPKAGNEKTYSQNLGMSIEYLDMTGKKLDVSRLQQGTDFMAVVRVTNPGNLGYYKDMALTRIFPSGWEIQNMRMFGSNLGNFNTADYEDIRDDRIYSYFNLSSGSAVKLAVKLTASYKGRFYLPAVKCETMYRDDIIAVSSGQWVEVVAPSSD